MLELRLQIIKIKMHSKKIIIIIAIVVFTVAILLVVLAMLDKPSDNTAEVTTYETPNYSVLDEEDIDSSHDTDSPTPDNEVPSNPIKGDPETIHDTSAPENSVSRNAQILSAVSENGDLVVITKLTGIPSGTCRLNISDSDETLSYSAEVIYSPEFSICSGYKILVDELLSRLDSTVSLVLTVDYNNETISSDVLEVAL